eukprot:jgi/Psemu1/14231/gm1.14231_g
MSSNFLKDAPTKSNNHATYNHLSTIKPKKKRRRSRSRNLKHVNQISLKAVTKDLFKGKFMKSSWGEQIVGTKEYTSTEAVSIDCFDILDSTDEKHIIAVDESEPSLRIFAKVSRDKAKQHLAQSSRIETTRRFLKEIVEAKPEVVRGSKCTSINAGYAVLANNNHFNWRSRYCILYRKGLSFQTPDDIKCYNNLGIGRPVQSGERERLGLNGHTFPPKQWFKLTPEARKHIKECIHYHPGNRPCLSSIGFNEWCTTTEEEIIEKYRRMYIEQSDDVKELKKEPETNVIKDNWNSFMKRATKQSKSKKRKLKQFQNKQKREKEDGNERSIVQWLHLYKKRWKSPEDLEEYNNYPVPHGAWGRVK